MASAPDRERLLAALEPFAAPPELALEWRDWRWFALLDEHVVFVADSDAGWSTLRREAALLRAARSVVGEAIPDIALEDPTLRLQLRARMSGVHGYAIEARIFGVADPSALRPGTRYATQCPLTAWGRTFAIDLGHALARFHRSMSLDDATTIGFTEARVDWDHVARVLREQPGLADLARAAEHVREWDASRPPPSVVLHGDPHFFNMFASDDGHLRGLVDVGDAALGDRHEDLRYLHSQGPHFARLAMEAYATEAGVAIDVHTVARLHVRTALEHFGFVAADAPRFPSIVAWTTEALHALTPEWASSRA